MARGDGDGDLAEMGIDEDVAAASFRRVFVLIATGAEPEEGEEVTIGWKAVTQKAEAMFAGDGDDDLTLSYAQFGDLLRAAYARAEGCGDGVDELPAFDELPPLARHAWIYLARHAANLFNMDDREVRKLGMHEGQIVDLARERFVTT